MRYLCLIYEDQKKVSGMSKSEMDAFVGEYFAFTEGIKKSGHYLGGEALQPVQTATTVRLRNGKVATTDGPFAETKEQPRRFQVCAGEVSRCGRSWSSNRMNQDAAAPVRERGWPS